MTGISRIDTARTAPKRIAAPRAVATIAAAALVAALAGCSLVSAVGGDAEPTASETSAEASTSASTSPTGTESAPPPDGVPTASGTPAPTPTEEQAQCSGLSGAEALATWVGDVPSPFPDNPDMSYVEWSTEWADPTTYDECLPLSWIVLPIEGGTASSPYHVMLFNEGQYLGVATLRAYGFFPDVQRIDDATIRIIYKYALPDETTAGASGHATADFTWNDETQQVDMTGDVPPT
ncbi:MAG: LppP/LprE family lipoprotein [Pseudoclavibacter sp.]